MVENKYKSFCASDTYTSFGNPPPVVSLISWSGTKKSRSTNNQHWNINSFSFSRSSTRKNYPSCNQKYAFLLQIIRIVSWHVQDAVLASITYLVWKVCEVSMPKLRPGISWAAAKCPGVMMLTLNIEEIVLIWGWSRTARLLCLINCSIVIYLTACCQNVCMQTCPWLGSYLSNFISTVEYLLIIHTVKVLDPNFSSLHV